MIDFDNRIFVYDKKRWHKLLDPNYCLPDPPSVHELQNAIILPLRKRTDMKSRNGAFEGGVCDADGKFFTGLTRHPTKPDCNLSCMKAYEVPADEITTRHETVVFGGVLNGMFTHTISESMCRLWWFADHPDTKLKIVFLESPAFGGFHNFQLLDAFGLTSDRIEMITTPTRFDKVIVPDENYFMVGGYRPGVEKFFHYANSIAKPSPYKKIYLSRQALVCKEVTFRETYFEEFYKRRGFKIVYPEQLPFAEQLSLVAGADEIVAPEGGLTILAQFCKPNAKVVFLTRSYDPHFVEIVEIQGVFKNCYVIDANFNFLPAELRGDASIYFMGPTHCFREYLDKTGCPYDEDEVSFEKQVAPYVMEYVKIWGELAAKPSTYKDYKNKSLIDVLNWSNMALFGKPIKRKDYPDCDEVEKLKAQSEEVQADEARLEELKAENENLKKQKKKLKKRIAEIEKSGSWKVTKPFRAVKKAFSKKKKG